MCAYNIGSRVNGSMKLCHLTCSRWGW